MAVGKSSQLLYKQRASGLVYILGSRVRNILVLLSENTDDLLVREGFIYEPDRYRSRFSPFTVSLDFNPSHLFLLLQLAESDGEYASLVMRGDIGMIDRCGQFDHAFERADLDLQLVKLLPALRRE